MQIDLVTLELVAGRVPADVLREVMAWLHVNQATLIEEWQAWQQ
jgi:hypothetical protein